MKKGYIECPYCANEIKEGAKKCQYCHEFLDKEEIKEKVVVKNKNEKKITISEANNKHIDYFYSIDICIIVCSFAKLRSAGWNRETRAIILIVAGLYGIFRLLAGIKVQRTGTTEEWKQRGKRKKIEGIIIAVIGLGVGIILANS